MTFGTTIPDKELRWYGAGHLFKNSVLIFPDVSQLGRTFGDEIFSESIGVAESIRLPYYCNIFQVEVLAMQAAVKIIWNSNIPKGNITILSDSQAAIRALGSNVMNSRTVYGCRKHLNKVAKRYNLFN